MRQNSTAQESTQSAHEVPQGGAKSKKEKVAVSIVRHYLDPQADFSFRQCLEGAIVAALEVLNPTDHEMAVYGAVRGALSTIAPEGTRMTACALANGGVLVEWRTVVGNVLKGRCTMPLMAELQKHQRRFH
ncbi:MAG: hypothetical protein G01um101477_357 [Candidatus Doudnabacteria bacterium Gr01-1014_77]|uniref:Uncharacterized protein n=1 Tax=Candidatus Doudnabacteria bacterium Gr01-1014_77 TaxID=2017133 RepID=A0A554JBS1_9BACT|nr:MAG: hypothetical protein G01um101477_357 [Candidatus Doudnabacteria bacterium Gr01-1014_77]